MGIFLTLIAERSCDMLDFCIYEPGKQDYWGQFEHTNDLWAFLEKAVPGFSAIKHYDKSSNEYRARYNVGDVMIVIDGI